MTLDLLSFCLGLGLGSLILGLMSIVWVKNFKGVSEQVLQTQEDKIAHLTQPVKESLEKLNMQIHELEIRRSGAYEGLKQQVLSMVETQQQLRVETGQLVRALRSPVSRGRWGEIQLKRVIELAGMVERCDFYQQVNLEDEGKKLRPDVVIRLPGGKSLVIDAKTPLDAYLDAIQADLDDTLKRNHLERYARHLREHIKALSSKSYWSQLEQSPEFVVLFLPGDHFFAAALEQDPTLIELGIEQGVVIATPTTLIALLRAVAYGWRHEALTQNAEKISELGAELYKRLGDMAKPLSQLGDQLTRTVASYNQAIGSFETRVLVSARKFKELQAAAESQTIPETEPVELLPRVVTGG